jgi:hypothetical protein
MSEVYPPPHIHQPSLASPDYMPTSERFNKDYASYDKVRRADERVQKASTIDKKRQEFLDREL